MGEGGWVQAAWANLTAMPVAAIAATAWGRIGAVDGVDFKIKADDRVGVIFLSFADQRAHCRHTIGFGAGSGRPRAMRRKP